MEWQLQYRNGAEMLTRVERQLNQDEYIFFVTGSYGDIFPNLCLMEAFHSLFNKRVNIIINERWKTCSSRFQYDFLTYHFINNNFEAALRRNLPLAGRPYLREPGFIFPLLPTLHPWIAECVLTQRMTDYECKRLLLGLPYGTPLRMPDLNEERKTEIYNHLKNDLKMPSGQSAILAFSTNSNPTASIETQKFIANFLNENNISVFFNQAKTFDRSYVGENYEQDDYRTISVAADCPIEFIDYAGYYIGSTHGLTAIASTLPASAAIAQTYFEDTKRLINNGVEISPDSLLMSNAMRHDLKNKVNLIPDTRDLAYLERQLTLFIAEGLT